ncbi:hypothetical protein L484_017912 [Morus notabilis]|uniref:AP2/ERF domain-containing protein n=1 Tax=Morus notabilis TaxID=981085 RepID=W9R943_9ROSA|nr:hypothetical protein L484_017912 [Morus notabilis]
MEAALAYDDAATKLYGPCAKLNLPDCHHQLEPVVSGRRMRMSTTAVALGKVFTLRRLWRIHRRS